MSFQEESAGSGINLLDYCCKWYIISSFRALTIEQQVREKAPELESGAGWHLVYRNPRSQLFFSKSGFLLGEQEG